MLDPANDMLPAPSSPSISSVSSSDLDTESTGSFFHDRSTTLGTLMGVSFPAITFRPSQHRDGNVTTPASVGRTKPKKRGLPTAAFGAELRRRRKWRWWRLCGDGDTKPASLGEFLEVERRFGDVAFFDDATELEGAMESHHRHHQHQEQPRNGRELFADGRVLPPATDDEGTSTAGALWIWRFPVSLTGICSGGAG
ncbi:hypothetical protein SLEP1_g17231 [Rubroshorea leprosula]|uniref:Uncharacterized protein n=1 Tax=Rubroshorea leprosula TaxID=152421 RepID=A0AAV5ITM9_9ROSI|nr:hypothetical protein SLEP1_g17231 [Rubroshorea leprosula]